jgi:arylformamidase
VIDITRPLSATTATWPGDTPLAIDWTLRLSGGDNVSLSRITLSPHIGTHADAPAHYDMEGPLSGALGLASFLGPARIVDMRGHEALTLAALKERGAIGSQRVLVRTLDVVRPEEFVSDFPPLAPEAAEAMAGAGLVLFGTDAPSVDPVDSAAMAAHRVLGAAAIPILENLDLSAAEPGDYDLVALPMKLMDAEATPVRALLLPPGSLGPLS